MAISKTAAPSKKRTRRHGAAKETRPESDGAYFGDWKRFCFALREIASGDDKGRPLSGHEAQKRAQAVLVERGYSWPGRASELPRLTTCVELKDEAAE